MPAEEVDSPDAPDAEPAAAPSAAPDSSVSPAVANAQCRECGLRAANCLFLPCSHKVGAVPLSQPQTQRPDACCACVQVWCVECAADLPAACVVCGAGITQSLRTFHKRL